MFCLSNALGFAQEAPPLPLIQRDACPFECCQFGQWIARSQIPVYKGEDDTSVVATLAEGDSFQAVTGNLHVEKAGIVVVTKPVDSLMTGDTVYSLAYRGEGETDIWQNGDIETVDMFWRSTEDTAAGQADSVYSGVLISRPLMVWWVSIQLPDGSTGWLRLQSTSGEGFEIAEQIDGLSRCD